MQKGFIFFCYINTNMFVSLKIKYISLHKKRQLIKEMKIRTILLLVFVCGLMGAQAQSRLTPISGAIYLGKGHLTNYDTELNSIFLSSHYKFA